MTNEERDIINQFIARVGGAPVGGQAGAFAGSVPATQPQQPALPPVDPEADGFIRQSFQRYPEAPYRITQLAFVQEHALAEAQNRIKRLEWELQQAQQAAQQGQPQQPQGVQPSAGGGGFFSGLFGGRPQAQQAQPGPSPVWNQGGQPPQYQPQPQYQQAPPPPQYPPNYQPSMFQRSGSGFLGSALTTAAGVAGGVVAADALMGLFHHGGGGFAGGYPANGAPIAESPWGGGMPAAGGGPWDNSGGTASNQDYVDNGTWDTPADMSGGSDPNNWDSSGGGDAGGSWDSGGGGSDDGGSWDSGGGGADNSLC